MNNLPDLLDVSQIKLIIKDLTSKISLKFASKKELNAEIETLTTEINTLKQSNQQLEARIEALENPSNEGGDENSEHDPEPQDDPVDNNN